MTNRNPADLPAADLRHELEALRALALEYHRARSTHWARATFGSVSVALQYERSVWGLRHRLMLAPKEYSISQADRRALLKALSIHHYKETPLPLYGRGEAVLISEEWYATRNRDDAHTHPGTGAS